MLNVLIVKNGIIITRGEFDCGGVFVSDVELSPLIEDLIKASMQKIKLIK